jgi:hypothetical protein
MDNFAKLVSGRLKTQPASAHPDPDLLTAFAENALPQGERKHLLKHLGTCSDCRETLFFALPDSAESQKVLAVGPKRVSRFALRWGTLAASAAIVGFLFTAHYSTRKSSNLPAGNQAVQIAAEKTPPDIDHLAMGGKASEAKQEQAAETKARPPAKHMTAKPQASLAFDSSGQVRVRSAPSPRDELSNQAAAGSAAKDSPAAPAGNTASQPIGERDAYKSANELGDVSRNRGPIPAERQSQSDLDLKKASPALAAGGADAAPSTRSALAQWMISPQGSLQRSDDSGETWQIVPVQPGASFRAFSTAGTEVWVAGNAGSLYHSSDSGRSWIRVEPTAAGHKLQADIISVDFSDPLKGAITTESGEVWTTSDGGKSWVLK